MSVATLSLRPLGKALGTEVVGVDVSRPFDAATLEWVERAFSEHPVLVFRDQRLGPEELAAFGAPRRAAWANPLRGGGRGGRGERARGRPAPRREETSGGGPLGLVRPPHAHARVRRSFRGRRRAPDRGAARPRDAGALRLLPL